MITIKFHKALLKYTNNVEEFSIDAYSIKDAISSIINMFPNLYNYMCRIKSGIAKENLVLINKNKEIINNDIIALNIFRPSKDSVLTLVPLVFGAGGRGIMIVAAVALIAFAAASIAAAAALAEVTAIAGTTAGAGFSSSVAGAFAAAGIGATGATIIGGIALSVGLSLAQQALFKPPSAPEQSATGSDGEARRNNDTFDGLTNSVSSNSGVALHYGMPRVGGQLLSGYVKTTNHGKEDVILVGDSF